MTFSDLVYPLVKGICGYMFCYCLDTRRCFFVLDLGLTKKNKIRSVICQLKIIQTLIHPHVPGKLEGLMFVVRQLYLLRC